MESIMVYNFPTISQNGTANHSKSQVNIDMYGL